MGEIGAFTSVSQFDAGSTGKCGFYAVATLAGSAAPGGQPWPAATIAASANANFVKFDGADIPSDQGGMNQTLLHSDLATYNLQYADIAANWTTIKQSLSNGKAVIICLPESQIIDTQVGGSPYPWSTTGIDHIILLTGIANDGNVLVRDSANITAPNNIRPGPRTYVIADMQPYWATAITPSWEKSMADLVSLENAYNAVVAEKNSLVAEKNTLNTKLLTLENAYNAVVAEKNSLVAENATLKTQSSAINQAISILQKLV
jgi:hypothetical protein